MIAGSVTAIFSFAGSAERRTLETLLMTLSGRLPYLPARPDSGPDARPPSRGFGMRGVDRHRQHCIARPEEACSCRRSPT
jgi:hypothetical protein